MSVWHKNLLETGKGAPAEALNVTRKLFDGLLLASKNLSLYPEGHSISIKSINKFHANLDAYLQQYGYLRLEIERDRIVSQGEEIFSGPIVDGTLPFTLFRDGIRWLEFTEGMDPEEITNFLKIVNQYKILSAEPEGDIVTTIWEAQFPHIQYEVADFFVGSEGEMKDSVSAFEATSTATKLRETSLDEQKYPSDPEIDPALLILSLEEQAQLLEMIRFEEEADFASYVNVLLDSLLLYRDEASFSTILDVLSEEFSGSLNRGEFEVTIKIVQGLRQIHENYRQLILWAGPTIENFFQKVSGLESLASIIQTWNDINAEQADILEQVFRQLHPQAIHTLVILLQKDQPKQHRQVLLDVIITLAAQDIRPLESLLNRSDDKLVENLIPIINGLEAEQSLRCMMKLMRHASALIRQKAIRVIMHRRLLPISEMFSLINDPDEAIRCLVLKQLGLSRDNAVEDLFLTYLKDTIVSNNQDRYIIGCFRSLGQCGSSRSVPFLRETLFRRKWMPRFWRSAYRKGAAVALEALKIPEAEQVLKEARRSLYPSLRSIFREANQEFREKRGGH